MRRATLLLGAILLCAACASPTSSGDTRTPDASAAGPSTTSASAPSPEASAPPSDLVGSWTRVQSCKQQLAAFVAAGLAVSHGRDWVRDNWVEPGTPGGLKDLCAGARPPDSHTHEFTLDGQFGSLDADGNRVDDGDYVIVDGDTVSFPSHASDFGYDGDLTVDYDVKDDAATFTVTLPKDCTGPCRDAYAWALSAFFAGRDWSRQ